MRLLFFLNLDDIEIAIEIFIIDFRFFWHFESDTHVEYMYIEILSVLNSLL